MNNNHPLPRTKFSLRWLNDQLEVIHTVLCPNAAGKMGARVVFYNNKDNKNYSIPLSQFHREAYLEN